MAPVQNGTKTMAVLIPSLNLRQIPSPNFSLSLCALWGMRAAMRLTSLEEVSSGRESRAVAF